MDFLPPRVCVYVCVCVGFGGGGANNMLMPWLAACLALDTSARNAPAVVQHRDIFHWIVTHARSLRCAQLEALHEGPATWCLLQCTPFISQTAAKLPRKHEHPHTMCYSWVICWPCTVCVGLLHICHCDALDIPHLRLHS